MTVAGNFSTILTIHIGLTVATCVKDSIIGPDSGDETVKKCIPLHSIVSPIMIIKLDVIGIEALYDNMK